MHLLTLSHSVVHGGLHWPNSSNVLLFADKRICRLPVCGRWHTAFSLGTSSVFLPNSMPTTTPVIFYSCCALRASSSLVFHFSWQSQPLRDSPPSSSQNLLVFGSSTFCGRSFALSYISSPSLFWYSGRSRTAGLLAILFLVPPSSSLLKSCSLPSLQQSAMLWNTTSTESSSSRFACSLAS